MKRAKIAMWITGGLAILGILIVAVAFSPENLATEVAKSLLQVLVIVVLGQIVSLIVSQVNYERQRLVELNQSRHALIGRLNQAFVEVKKVRRLLRATSQIRTVSGHKEDRVLSESLYHEYLQALNHAQLDLELISKDLKSHQALFSKSGPAKRCVDSMEDYLNSIVDEYEHTTAEFTGDPPSCDLENFPRLGDFLGYYRETEFRPRFVHAYYKALELIRSDLAEYGGGTNKHESANNA